MRRSMLRRGISLLLALVMILSNIPATAPHAHAASNVDGGLEGQEADVFTALGFDTSVEPEGYDADTTENPYGRDKLAGNQIFEMVVGSSDGLKIVGKNNNSATVSGTVDGLSGTQVPLDIFSGVAGDFDGDGLPGEIVYVGIPSFKLSDSSCENLPVNMYLFDGKNSSFGGSRQIATLNKVKYEESEIYYGGAEGRLHVTKIAKMVDRDLYGFTEVAAGDFDGDGYAEIAVYTPQSGNARVDIYKWMRDANSTADGWKNWSNWSAVWSHPLDSSGYVPNMVSLLASDINRDGIDDLGISYSGTRREEDRWGSSNWRVQTTSKALILWGANANMLQSSSNLNLCEGELGTQIRTSLIAGDINSDGYPELIVTGQPSNNFGANTIRSIVVYSYSGDGKLVSLYSGNQKIVDGSYVVTEESNDKGEIQEVEKWSSNNGFDDRYLSMPYLRTNAAVVKLDGYDYNYLYLDSCMYEFVEGSLTLKMCLDDASYDGNNSLDMPWLSAEPYMEYGAVAADLNGNSFQQLYSGFAYAHSYSEYNTIAPVDDPNTSENELEVYNDPAKYNRYVIRASGYSGFQGNGNGGLTDKTYSRTVNQLIPDTQGTMVLGEEDIPHYAMVAADVDMDTTLITYTGVHYLTYSDPKVMAVIAAAPYFKDVDVISDYDYAWQNTTSWSKVNGQGNGDLVTVDLEAGGFYSSTKVLSSFLTELETSVNFTMEWEKEVSNTKEYTLTFETSQDEDAVVFFSVPTENYVYEIRTPDGKGGYKEPETKIISNTFQPVYQVLNLDYYESIREDYVSDDGGDAVLPAIAGVVLTSTPGDPASYPSSTAGYQDVEEWDKEPAGVSFGNGAITQEITITNETSESYNFGCALDFQLGFGGKTGVAMGSVTEFEAQGGIQFSLNPGGGFTKLDLSGVTISGTVTNMPLEFQDYGYYYNWKIFSYSFDFGKDKIPVVSYVVNDVSEPPQLPEDFQQDVERTTSDKNVLTWSYDQDYSKFIIYKYFDFPVGGGLEKVAEYAAGETPYILKYDTNGKPYKEYYFEDVNLTPYAEYQYAIQVERLSKTPPLSAPSGLVTARTKAAVGNPLLSMSESDGKNDGNLLVYPDRNAYLTANVTGPDGETPYSYYSTVQYQWQRKVNGAWTDMTNETGKTIAFESAGRDVIGEYRCRVNVLTKADKTAITSYTDSVELQHSKRTSVLEEVYVREVKGGIELCAKVTNAHSDSGAIPTGMVTFNLIHIKTGMPYQYVGELDSTGTFKKTIDGQLPAGTYEVVASYGGSTIFKTCEGNCVFLSQLAKGYMIDAPDSAVYGDGMQISFNMISTINGFAVTEKTDAASFTVCQQQAIRLKADWQGGGLEEGDIEVHVGDTVKAGQEYHYYDSLYHYFTAPIDGVITWISEYMDVEIQGFVEHDCLTKTDATGVYRVADNTPAGTYQLRFTDEDGAVYTDEFIVKPREITLQMPTLVKKQDTGATMGDITYAELPLFSGTWASCDADADGNVTGSLAATSVDPSYVNTAGKAFNKDSNLETCGFYTITAQDTLDNYAVSYRIGSLSVVGGNKPVTFGVRPFEGKDNGTLYMVTPDYAYTREALGLKVSQAVGNRLVFSAVPDDGYQVYDWYVNGVAQNNTSTSLAFVMLNQEATVEVQFVFKPDTLVYGITGAVEGGTLTCSNSGLTSGSIVIPNTYLTFTAEAKEGYHFKEWRYTELGKGTAYYTDDAGKQNSEFMLLMPKNSCSLYAVFERDGYTLTYTDKNGNDGLTAWYWGNPSGDTTAAPEKITVASGDIVPGDAEVVIQPRDGFGLDDHYNFVSSGAQGVADYEKGTYTLTMTQDTAVTGYTIRENYDVTLAFNIQKTYIFCEGAQVTLTVDGTEYLYDCPETAETFTIFDVPGGSKISAAVTYPGYYNFLGWDVNGTVLNDEACTVEELDDNTTITLQLTEKPVYEVTLADISGKGTYTVTLPDGAGQSGNVVTCHENDPLTIQVTPEVGYTVTYWKVTAAEGTGWESKASSLKYQFPKLTADYSFTPVFSGTTYHTVSWPTLRYYNVNLTPVKGYLSTVSNGGTFCFTLSGGEDEYEVVLVNGRQFSNDVAGNFWYEVIDGVKVYTIRNITADQEISVCKNEDVPVRSISVTPSPAKAAAGKTITLTATAHGFEPVLYMWYQMDGNEKVVLFESASNEFLYEVPLTPGVVETVYVTGVTFDNGRDETIAQDYTDITIMDAVADIAVTVEGLTVAEDGNYLLYPITPNGEIGEYDFDAEVRMVSGQTSADVTWTLWGAQRRGTTVNADGVLTVSDREKGTDGCLKLIATYTYDNGDTDKQETVINLCYDAYVATEVVNGIHGTINQIGYAPDGTTVTVVATPDEHHAVAKWFIDGKALLDVTANELPLPVSELTHYTVSVEFTHYYPEMKHDEVDHWLECSCGHKIEVENHYDFDKEHFCDKCGYRMTECVDEDKDHFCDWCGVRMSECADEVQDHLCDWCGDVLSTCVDENTDHICDWCGETISQCEDVNKNHFCDYCKEKITECVDASFDHNCDICGRVLSECADENADHLCDWCGQALTECEDTDQDHNCDLCGEKLSDCTDENRDHDCDYCGKEDITECADVEPADHKCDICGEKLTECADEDKDHLCDVCDEKFSDCTDEDKNHKCDICAEKLTECTDENKDHLCDVCGEKFSDCTDDDKDHNCDICGKEDITECTDTDPLDHKCDICGADLDVHTDENSDHLCDEPACGKVLSDCADENPADHYCDVCGKELSDCADENKDHNCDICGKEQSVCVDDNKDHKCDICGKVLTECVDENSDHYCDTCKKQLTSCVDENADDICDICGKELNVHDCIDENNNHKCDICGKTVSECVDTNKDHNCDLCGTKLSQCADEDNNHKCDVCGEELSACVDQNKDHKCDTCGETVSGCVDANKDHNCDICGAEMTQCKDEDRNHKCDICGAVLSQCDDKADEETGLSDHLCDICGVELSKCADTDNNHKCDICGKTFSKCADDNKDHNCDICGTELSKCDDKDNNHLCDICSAALSSCDDADNDHACDICGITLTVCVDDVTDHKCDICGAEFTNLHTDDNKNHLCDEAACGKVLSECTDENKDHNCDICGTGVSNCTDKDKDHNCDICGDKMTDCDDKPDAETNLMDHKCDICAAVLTQCVDTDLDHICDVCGAEMHECADADNDHFCDHCGYKLTDCVDEETDEEGKTDHLCDICGASNSICADGDNDHKCDVCGEKLTDCTDADDHKCDICGETVSECMDSNHDDVCDICGAATNVHVDENKDHRCDVCALPLSECDDADKDHLCDFCGTVWSVCVDKDMNHVCEICGGNVGTHAPAEGSHICDYCGEVASECGDGDRDHLCDICGEVTSECADDNHDHFCDLCGKSLSECEDTNNDHLCDLCGIKLTDCTDEDNNHICEYCGEVVSECTDKNGDHICDLCGEVSSTCSDNDGDHCCDLCGAVISECLDEDYNHRCDICGKILPITDECLRDDSCILYKYRDVVLSEWYHDGLHGCVELGIMQGISKDELAPAMETNRAQLVVMLYRIAGEPSVNGMTEPFADVNEDHWFYEAVIWAYQNNIVKGVSETAFAPGTSITREQLATILYRYTGEPEVTGNLEDYPDADSVSDYARSAMLWAVFEGLINGMTQKDGSITLSPTTNANRAQIATILMRYLRAQETVE